MISMHWKKEMSVGLDQLDEDHRFLIRVINRLGESTNDPDSADVIKECLASLKNYAEFHFAREEAVMRACGYATLAEHQAEHRAFTARIADVARRYDEGDEPPEAAVNLELFEYLKDWLTHHILVIDMGYRPLVDGNPKASAAARQFKGSQLWYGA